MSKRIEDVVMPFGKHSGKTLSQIVADDAGYLDWLIGNATMREPLATAVAAMHVKYAKEIDEAVESGEFRRSER